MIGVRRRRLNRTGNRRGLLHKGERINPWDERPPIPRERWRAGAAVDGAGGPPSEAAARLQPVATNAARQANAPAIGANHAAVSAGNVSNGIRSVTYLPDRSAAFEAKGADVPCAVRNTGDVRP